jgi:hypothetical protein
MTPRNRAALLVCVVATLPYLWTLGDYFVQDDFGVVSLLAGKPALSFFGWFTHTWMDNIWGYTPDEIRPFPALTYQLTALGDAGSPVADHLLNVALHVVNALLVLGIGRIAAGLTRPAATAAACIFALLPVHPESVIWVTGRVDSMPALAYLSAFLAYVRFRATGARHLYIVAVAAFFVALFTKQNTVTFGPAIVLFDAVVLGRAVRPSWAWLRPYVPFALLTVAYLLLRYALFGEVARESLLTPAGLAAFSDMAARHVARIAAGRVVPVAPLIALLAVAAGAVGVVAVKGGREPWHTLRAALFFLIVWTALGIAPVLVAGYESPRHVYLASVGWAIGIGIVIDVLWRSQPSRLTKPAVAATVTLLLAVYAWELAHEVQRWRARAHVSRQAVVDLEREAAAAPPGSLMIVDVPPRSWEWALPFAARPPFATVDLTRRVRLVSPIFLYCCRGQWHDDTRQTLAAWAGDPSHPPVIALHWHEQTGRLSRLDGRDDPYLGALMRAAAEIPGEDALDQIIAGAAGAAAAAQ